MVSEGRQKRGARSYRRGLWAEFFCQLVLVLKGYRLLEKRYKTPLGEIDLIAARGKAIVFVEVKARPNKQAGGEAISEQQKVRLRRAAAAYLSSCPQFIAYNQRFDVMLVLPMRLPIHIVNAF